VLVVDPDRDWEQVTELSHAARWRFLGSDPSRPIGWELRSVGDVNGDGEGDLLVGTRAGRDHGVAYLIFISANLPAEASVRDLVGQGLASEIRVEEGLSHRQTTHYSGAGDVNGDGLMDLLVGNEGGGQFITQGIVYLVFGARDFPPVVSLREAPAEPDGVVRIFGEGPHRQSGVVGPAGDFNADGLSDFLIGAPLPEHDAGPGKVHVIYGSPSMRGRIELSNLRGEGLTIRGFNVPGGAGFNVGPYGDLNGDGLSDFAFAESGGIGRQRYYVIFGPYGQKPFLRGDFNADGVVDIADPLSLLSFLFMGTGPYPICMDAGDVDDGGSLELTDAVLLLLYLFLGGEPPAHPYPQPGPDPSDDTLGCLGF
jgi:hypothetical protein